MTLLDAPKYNARRAALIRNISITLVVLLAISGVLAWFLWDWPEEHRVNRFFAAVESSNLQQAFSIWNNDPDWQQHADRFKPYDFAQFQKDWGVGSDYGQIKSHKIIMTKTAGNGVVMGVDINGGKTPIFLRVDHKAKTIGFSPIELYVGP